MNQNLIGVYFTFFIVAGMIAYAGVEETIKVFDYIGLQIRFFWVRIRMAVMRYQLKRELDRMTKAYKKDLEEIDGNRKQEFF